MHMYTFTYTPSHNIFRDTPPRSGKLLSDVFALKVSPTCLLCEQSSPPPDVSTQLCYTPTMSRSALTSPETLFTCTDD
eukprot:1344223-Amorphochlora_amoeboformis.AAC.1